jgi:CheY-like chemotaxis protein
MDEQPREKAGSLAKLAHELRNALAPLGTAIQLIAAEPDRRDQVLHLTRMMSQKLEQLASLIDELANVAQVASNELPPAHVSTQVETAHTLPSLKILLVDDNQSAVHMMSRLLQKLGQDVHVADCGPAALEQLSKIAPDIVISDVAMPGMTGYDLARQIRNLDLPSRPYLVAVTGFGQESDRQAALAAGFDKHLTKPVGVGTLQQLLRAHGAQPRSPS